MTDLRRGGLRDLGLLLRRRSVCGMLSTFRCARNWEELGGDGGTDLEAAKDEIDDGGHGDEVWRGIDVEVEL